MSYIGPRRPCPGDIRLGESRELRCVFIPCFLSEMKNNRKWLTERVQCRLQDLRTRRRSDAPVQGALLRCE